MSQEQQAEIERLRAMVAEQQEVLDEICSILGYPDETQVSALEAVEMFAEQYKIGHRRYKRGA